MAVLERRDQPASRGFTALCLSSVAHWLLCGIGCQRPDAFDGVWTVTIQTAAGNCDRTTNYVLTVADGRVSGPQNATGTVGRQGNVRVTVGAAYANGQLAGSSGSGKWNAGSSGVPCSRSWQASKR